MIQVVADHRHGAKKWVKIGHPTRFLGLTLEGTRSTSPEAVGDLQTVHHTFIHMQSWSFECLGPFKSISDD